MIDATAYDACCLVVGRRDRVVQALQQRLMGLVALDAPPNVKAQEIIRTFPDGVACASRSSRATGQVSM